MGLFEDEPDRVLDARVELGATAIRINPGHRLRVVIACAAHPRLARHTGTADPASHATDLRAQRVAVAVHSGGEAVVEEGASFVELPLRSVGGQELPWRVHV